MIFRAGSRSSTCQPSSPCVSSGWFPLRRAQSAWPQATLRLTGTEYAADTGSDEFRFTLGGGEQSGRTGRLTLRDYRIQLLPVPKASPGIKPGVSLIVNLDHPQFAISLHYDVFASTSRTPLGMIRKWYRMTNRTGQTQELSEIGMNHLRIRNEFARRLTLYHWQGGGADRGTPE